MQKNILIVESDPALAQTMKSELEARGFLVENTPDGKKSPDLIREKRPDLVVLGVELSAGQNGYIICGKLKKDDDLKNIPIVIFGNKDGFAQHRKLKTRADEYVAKPLDTNTLIDTVGGLIGFPEPSPAEDTDESVSLSDLVEEEESAPPAPREAMTVEGDPDLDMLDQAFDGISADANSQESVVLEADEAEELPPETPSDAGDDEASIVVADEEEEALEALGDGAEEVASTQPHRAAPPPRPAQPTSSPAGADRRVKELEAAVAEANQRAEEAERRSGELEQQLAARPSDGGGARGGKSDKEFFALKDSVNKKDKEILRLKNELNAKETELLELRDREVQLEQQASQATAEVADRDEQLKALAQRSEQNSGDRRRFERDLASAREETRTATSRLQTLEADLADLQQRNAEIEGALGQAQSDAAEARGELEATRSELETIQHEAEEFRSQVEQLQAEIESTKEQLTAQATAFAQETSGLRKKVAEAEESARKHGERATRVYQRLREDEKVREKTRKALAIALQLLEDQPPAGTGEEGAEK